jgi:hypothetical protein
MSRQLNQNDIPALMCLVMDRMGLSEFHFTIQDLMDVKGRIALDHEDAAKSRYVMRRKDK